MKSKHRGQDGLGDRNFVEGKMILTAKYAKYANKKK
jgi:hypothetical protein